MMDYKYLGDRYTCPTLKGRQCAAVRRPDGKCIRGRNSNMLVKFDNGIVAVIVARLLRKLTPFTSLIIYKINAPRLQKI